MAAKSHDPLDLAARQPLNAAGQDLSQYYIAEIEQDAT